MAEEQDTNEVGGKRRSKDQESSRGLYGSL